jgi:hypothetical protein
MAVTSEPYVARPGFDPEKAGRVAECDGGMAAPSGGGTREEFTGTLTGEFVDHGDPPWRWYRLINLTRKPEGHSWDSVWCEADSLYLVDGTA